MLDGPDKAIRRAQKNLTSLNATCRATSLDAHPIPVHSLAANNGPRRPHIGLDTTTRWPQQETSGCTMAATTAGRYRDTVWQLPASVFVLWRDRIEPRPPAQPAQPTASTAQTERTDDNTPAPRYTTWIWIVSGDTARCDACAKAKAAQAGGCVGGRRVRDTTRRQGAVQDCRLAEAL